MAIMHWSALSAQTHYVIRFCLPLMFPSQHCPLAERLDLFDFLGTRWADDIGRSNQLLDLLVTQYNEGLMMSTTLNSFAEICMLMCICVDHSVECI